MVDVTPAMDTKPKGTVNSVDVKLGGLISKKEKTGPSSQDFENYRTINGSKTDCQQHLWEML